jgi:uncharacterized protein (TIGR00251 family)
LKTIQVKVKPSARSRSLRPGSASSPWLAQIKSRPVDGKANLELIELLAEHFKCRRSQVVIKSGASSRLKLIQIHI